MCVFTYLFSDLAGHLFSKVPVLTDSVEQLATFHHLHNNQEPRSVKIKTRKEVADGQRTQQKRGDGLTYRQTNSHTQSSLPRAGLVRELDTVGVNLQDLHYVWVVGTHHMETHLHGGESNTEHTAIHLNMFILKACERTANSGSVQEVMNGQLKMKSTRFYVFKLQQRRQSIYCL